MTPDGAKTAFLGRRYMSYANRVMLKIRKF